jgi:hypothetical protein
MGMFDSLWNQVNRAMTERGYENERKALIEYIEERPSADDARQWLQELGMEKVEVKNYPLEITTGPASNFIAIAGFAEKFHFAALPLSWRTYCFEVLRRRYL